MQMSGDQALFITGGVGGNGRGLFRGAEIFRGGTRGDFVEVERVLIVVGSGNV